MTIDIDALEAAAKAATPGPWEDLSEHPDHLRGTINKGAKHIAGCSWFETPREEQRVTVKEALANATFIAAANPATVLELVAELRAEREKYTNAVKAYKAVVQEGEWLAFQVYKPRRRCPPLQECDPDDIVTEKDCQQCWLNAARETVEKGAKE